MKVIALASAAVALFALGALAHAAAPWKTVESEEVFGQHYSFAGVSDSVTKPKALAVRPTGPGGKKRTIEVTYSFTCSSKALKLRNGRIHPLSISDAQVCDVNAVATLGKAASVKIELLKRP